MVFGGTQKNKIKIDIEKNANKQILNRDLKKKF